jgi:hypothetical protein
MFVLCILGELPQPKHDRKDLRKHIDDRRNGLSETIELDSGFLDYLLGKKTLSRYHVKDFEKSTLLDIRLLPHHK